MLIVNGCDLHIIFGNLSKVIRSKLYTCHELAHENENDVGGGEEIEDKN